MTHSACLSTSNATAYPIVNLSHLGILTHIQTRESPQQWISHGTKIAHSAGYFVETGEFMALDTLEKDKIRSLLEETLKTESATRYNNKQRNG